MKKILASALTLLLALGSILTPSVASAASMPKTEDNQAEVIANFDYLQLDDSLIKDGFDVAKPTISVRSNQTDGGGSDYSFASRRSINLQTSGINSLYGALLAGGLATLKLGKAAARAIVTTGVMSNYKNWTYMRQTIYTKSDKKFKYFKVIDEFTNNKKTWKGAVNTSYQRVRK